MKEVKTMNGYKNVYIYKGVEIKEKELGNGSSCFYFYEGKKMHSWHESNLEAAYNFVDRIKR